MLFLIWLPLIAFSIIILIFIIRLIWLRMSLSLLRVLWDIAIIICSLRVIEQINNIWPVVINISVIAFWKQFFFSQKCQQNSQHFRRAILSLLYFAFENWKHIMRAVWMQQKDRFSFIKLGIIICIHYPGCFIDLISQMRGEFNLIALNLLSLVKFQED